jgi:hypothetical protein
MSALAEAVSSDLLDQLDVILELLVERYED